MHAHHAADHRKAQACTWQGSGYARCVTHPFFQSPLPIAFAHRGGAKRWPENTLAAFQGAIDLGYRYFETDVHLTKDGQLVCIHDETTDRTTNGTGLVRDKTLEELKRLDTGYRFEREGELPFRGQGLTVPTVEEILALRGDVRFVLEIKPPGNTVAEPLWDFIDTHGVHDRVLVASQHDSASDAFRKLCGDRVPTSGGQGAIRRFWWRVRLGVARWSHFPFDALQVPPQYEHLEVVTQRFVDAAHHHGIHVHVWTIDDPVEMNRLLDLGVDGIMTDVPEMLLEVIAAR